MDVRLKSMSPLLLFFITSTHKMVFSQSVFGIRPNSVLVIENATSVTLTCSLRKRGVIAWIYDYSTILFKTTREKFPGASSHLTVSERNQNSLRIEDLYIERITKQKTGTYTCKETASSEETNAKVFTVTPPRCEMKSSSQVDCIASYSHGVIASYSFECGGKAREAVSKVTSETHSNFINGTTRRNKHELLLPIENTNSSSCVLNFTTSLSDNTIVFIIKSIDLIQFNVSDHSSVKIGDCVECLIGMLKDTAEFKMTVRVKDVETKSSTSHVICLSDIAEVDVQCEAKNIFSPVPLTDHGVERCYEKYLQFLNGSAKVGDQDLEEICQNRERMNDCVGHLMPCLQHPMIFEFNRSLELLCNNRTEAVHYLNFPKNPKCVENFYYLTPLDLIYVDNVSSAKKDETFSLVLDYFSTHVEEICLQNNMSLYSSNNFSHWLSSFSQHFAPAPTWYMSFYNESIEKIIPLKNCSDERIDSSVRKKCSLVEMCMKILLKTLKDVYYNILVVENKQEFVNETCGTMYNNRSLCLQLFNDDGNKFMKYQKIAYRLLRDCRFDHPLDESLQASLRKLTILSDKNMLEIVCDRFWEEYVENLECLKGEKFESRFQNVGKCSETYFNSIRNITNAFDVDDSLTDKFNASPAEFFTDMITKRNSSSVYFNHADQMNTSISGLNLTASGRDLYEYNENLNLSKKENKIKQNESLSGLNKEKTGNELNSLKKLDNLNVTNISLASQTKLCSYAVEFLNCIEKSLTKLCGVEIGKMQRLISRLIIADDFKDFFCVSVFNYFI
ncbi:hypothetical protein HELRODRAFT_171687 [Helobdella robusta]|uniref:Ig-like domain-containing protein n=1 Tax=Helobdella robusta TaxID=6412 RepID=T1F4K0_HELRO|nr:hypothetical protein HELRODRAFT_171687 [Helobdella robusta]ESO05319.1 hypothetical protein HELRODRAFT_171687 [Helobdella robusta]